MNNNWNRPGPGPGFGPSNPMALPPMAMGMRMPYHGPRPGGPRMDMMHHGPGGRGGGPPHGNWHGSYGGPGPAGPMGGPGPMQRPMGMGGPIHMQPQGPGPGPMGMMGGRGPGPGPMPRMGSGGPMQMSGPPAMVIGETNFQAPSQSQTQQLQQSRPQEKASSTSF